MDEDYAQKIALLRLSILGPLISARLEHGDRIGWFRAAAEKTYEAPDGRWFRVSARTIEDWYRAWQHGGLQALRPATRCDAGRSRVIGQELGELILRLKRERPRRSVRRIIRMLERARQVTPGELSKSTAHRFLQQRGLSARPQRLEEDRRAFRHPFAGDLWMGDVKHGSRVIAPQGHERKAYLHLWVDSATRFVPGAEFRLGETALDLQAVLKEAVAKHGLPRAVYLDQGAAQRAESLVLICAELSVRLLHCRAYDPEAKGAVERLIRTVDEEVIGELGPHPRPLGEVNGLLWSWLSVEYHRRVHSGTGRQPLEHWLSQTEHLRPAPRAEVLDQAFLHRVRRRVRNDSTVPFGAGWLEVRSELRRQWVELRFDPQRPGSLPRVFVEGEFYCDATPLDVVGNAGRRRRPVRAAADAEGDTAPSGLDPLAQIQAEHDRRVRPPRAAPRPRHPRHPEEE